MQKISYFALLLIALCSCTKPEVALVPKAQVVAHNGDLFKLDAGLHIEADNELVSTAAYLKPLVEHWNASISVKGNRVIPIALELGDVADGNPEAYSLSVNKTRITIKGNTPAGCFHGIQSLKQLITLENGQLMVQQAEIVDYPNFAWRSYMLDEARHFYGKEFVMRLLDELSALKINKFHWHLTDDAGWRIEIKQYPKLTEVGAFRKNTEAETWGSGKLTGIPHGGFYTQDDIKEVIAYAAERHIQVIPEIEMPGHASAAIAAYP